ncbi:MAG TPA: hypothetical protein VM913_09085 [Sphingomicrobium sp.]|jgi:hypothetical protein|nr:hypothetical protein [Sphingomicrobium sp.]
MNLTPEYQRRFASLARAEAGRSGKVPVSFATIALARRLAGQAGAQRGGVDPISASATSARPWLLRA